MKLSINSEATPSPPTILTKEQLKSIYLKIFSGEDGKIVLEDLAHMSGVYRSNFIRQESNYTAFNEGMRALFLYICSQASEDDGVDNIEGKGSN
ncbi:hypothetical protein [Candidatus Tisiphia endosymbiont of Metellina segmentata]|uniref:Bbp19 family protein n=1 Tax=Candidatus Tisiphia endosymbiont of Metellina segmentata TaxID=3066274 RepID=UPI00313E1CF2|nr:hypothetical protein [Rickettsiaceae bacterium]MDD9336952.1 hypothetical protein [Rickettsiaceae bacterium]